MTGPNLGNYRSEARAEQGDRVGADFGFFNQSVRSVGDVLQQALDRRHSAGAGELRGDRRGDGARERRDDHQQGTRARAQRSPVHVARRRRQPGRELRAQHRQRRVALSGRAVHSVHPRRLRRFRRIVDGRLRARRHSRTGFRALRIRRRRSRFPASASSRTSTRRAALARRRARSTSPASTTSRSSIPTSA